jgi:hypothetical protein
MGFLFHFYFHNRFGGTENSLSDKLPLTHPAVPQAVAG